MKNYYNLYKDLFKFNENNLFNTFVSKSELVDICSILISYNYHPIYEKALDAILKNIKVNSIYIDTFQIYDALNINTIEQRAQYLCSIADQYQLIFNNIKNKSDKEELTTFIQDIFNDLLIELEGGFVDDIESIKELMLTSEKYDAYKKCNVMQTVYLHKDGICNIHYFNQNDHDLPTNNALNLTLDKNEVNQFFINLKDALYDQNKFADDEINDIWYLQVNDQQNQLHIYKGLLNVDLLLNQEISCSNLLRNLINQTDLLAFDGLVAYESIDTIDIEVNHLCSLSNIFVDQCEDGDFIKMITHLVIDVTNNTITLTTDDGLLYGQSELIYKNRRYIEFLTENLNAATLLIKPDDNKVDLAVNPLDKASISIKVSSLNHKIYTFDGLFNYQDVPKKFVELLNRLKKLPNMIGRTSIFNTQIFNQTLIHSNQLMIVYAIDCSSYKKIKLRAYDANISYVTKVTYITKYDEDRNAFVYDFEVIPSTKENILKVNKLDNIVSYENDQDPDVKMRQLLDKYLPDDIFDDFDDFNTDDLPF